MPDRTRGRLIAGLLFIGAGLVQGVVVGWSGELGAGVFLAVAGVAIGALRPREATFVALASGLLQYLFTKAYPVVPLVITGFDDLLILGVAIRVGVDLAFGKRPFDAPTVLLAAAVWVCGGTATGLLHGESVSTIVMAVRGVMLPLTFLFAAGLYVSDARDRERLRWVIVSITAFHALLSIVQWVGAPSRYDIAYGVLGPGGANAAGFLDLLGLVLLLARPLPRRLWPVAAVLFVAPMVSSARAAVYVMPLALLLVFISRGSLSKTMARGLSALSAAGAALWVYSLLAGRGFEDFALSTLFKAQYSSAQGGRLLYAEALPVVLGQDIMLWLFGLGPGTFTSFVGVGTLAPAFRLVAPLRPGVEGGFAYPDIEWVALLGEYGVIGVAAVVLLLLAPLYRWATRRDQAVARLDVTVALPAVCVITLASMFTLNTLEVQPLAYVSWAVCGLIYSLPSDTAVAQAETGGAR